MSALDCGGRVGIFPECVNDFQPAERTPKIVFINAFNWIVGAELRFSRMRQGLSNCRTYSFWDSSSLRFLGGSLKVAFQLAAALTCNSHVLDFLASAKLCRSQLCLKPSTSHCRERVGIISVALFITIPLPPLFENIENKGNSHNLLLANNMRTDKLTGKLPELDLTSKILSYRELKVELATKSNCHLACLHVECSRTDRPRVWRAVPAETVASLELHC